MAALRSKEAVAVRRRDDGEGVSGGAPGPPDPPGPAGSAGSAGDDVRLSGRDAERDRARATDLITEGIQGAGPAEVPGRLCAVAVKLLPVTGASVSLRSDGMPVQLTASNEQAAHVAEIQATLGDGPCMEAAHTGAPVLAGDLDGDRDAGRWPVFAQQATEAGVRALYSIPLGSDTVCVGTLDLCSDTPGDLTSGELSTARLVAGVMTVALMALPREEENGLTGNGPWLSGLASDHDEVYQAVGMIMVQLGVGADEALARLRGHAFAHGRTALEVAHEVVSHRKRFGRDR
ncbi:GAF and ANTAR domain-containing protein [Streptomyces lincolnensis]|uniref:GAF and ANTAR domain-containing protein n=1 Tax=Streptomyces lincolnensis TaxID=1915 RepID=UPI001E37583D|nr:GAF and ANTAR domain-containing protein [Streptomyces lincolnensis]MCD7440405.1 GAF and ANTAR domain-containing protein [Streptomyces lincolnensis]